MKYCKKCKVDISGNVKVCPLCQHETEGEKSPSTFPYIPTTYQKYNLFFKILIFLSLFASLSVLLINYAFPHKGWWSLFVILGIASFWIFTYIAIQTQSNLTRTSIYQALLVCLLALLWDYTTHWRGWSIDFVIPIVLSVTMITISVIAKVLKVRIEDYLAYLLIGVICGIIPLFLIIADILHTIYPSIICIFISLFFLSSLLIFQGKNIKTELKRRLHI